LLLTLDEALELLSQATQSRSRRQAKKTAAAERNRAAKSIDVSFASPSPRGRKKLAKSVPSSSSDRGTAATEDASSDSDDNSMNQGQLPEEKSSKGFPKPLDGKTEGRRARSAYQFFMKGGWVMQGCLIVSFCRDWISYFRLFSLL